MKVLVVVAPSLGRVLPLVPLAVALHEAGHDVRVATGAAVTTAHTRGLPVEDVTVGLRWRRDDAGTVAAVVDLARRWHPDLVVHEPRAVAGAIAAARLGVPAVLQENSLADGPQLAAAALRSRALQASVHHHGLDHLPAPALVLTVAPPSVVGPRAGRPLRAVHHTGGGQAPEWLRRPCYRPRIIVSGRTAAGPTGGRPARAVAAAATALDADVVLVRPGGRTARRGLSGNVHRTGWVPLDQVLPHATALVHHGGAGGVLGALAAGLPQLVVPGRGDRRSNAALVAARGAGLAVTARGVTAEVLSHLVRDAELRTTAQRVQREMAGMPAPADLVADLERIAERRLRR